LIVTTKTPLRVSFFSGGSDIFSFYQHETGAALSATLSKYVYVSVYDTLDQLRFVHNDDEQISHIDEMQSKITKETLKSYGQPSDVTITSITDIYCNGSGLGSSSAYTVGIVHALKTKLNKNDGLWPEIPPKECAECLAKSACTIEIEKCGYPIGKQDQYAAAIGGLNLFEFKPNGEVLYDKLWSRDNILSNLSLHLMLVYTGRNRTSSNILSSLKNELKKDSPKFDNIRRNRDRAYKGLELLKVHNFDDFGRLLHESWVEKKQITPDATFPEIDDLYTAALKEGALGGKVLGAGGGGYMLLYVPIDDKQNVYNLVKHLGFKAYSVSFTSEGSRVILNESS
jgi:D-glycero-alpha-D-manno-heptose-7-phosphate kinase